MKILCLDTEVTHLDTSIARVIEVHLEDVDTHDFLFKRRNPGIPIPPEATNVHGITDEMVAPLKLLDNEDVVELIAYIEPYDAIVGYNPDFDIDILRNEFKRLGFSCRWPKTVVCCKRMWDHFDPKPPRTLSDAYRAHVSPYGFHGAHGAGADVAATIEVFEALRTKYDEDHEMSLRQYDPKRATWCGPTDHFKWNDPEKREFLIVCFGKYNGKTVGSMDNGMCQWITKHDFPEHVKRICSVLMQSKITDTLERDNYVAEYARERDK